jgi:hypothetical protein
MPPPPSVAPFVGQIADLAADLRRGSSCLVVCDKGWTLPVYVNLKERLRAMGLRCGYLDGRPTGDTPAETGTMLAAVAQMRWAVRTAEMDGVVFALPHLDVMTAIEGGWNNISREAIPLLYENPTSIWLGFQDPTLPLLPIIEKLFGKRYVIEERYRDLETVAPSPPPEGPHESEPQPVTSQPPTEEPGAT